ncbi:methyltransferase family protein [Gorillibacterium timonense]|uniref:methyltransferase family protein n=1 Tax=Gorillibacterium timonense TaxID=1689269 RepID=UPI00071C3C19|nr:isoprenylcysteine carboxylmethyltransferase family protein [Gorillibacterium timonense]
MDRYQIIGLIAFLLFYGSYLVKQLLQRRQGIATDRLGRGTKPKRTSITEVVLKATTFTTTVVQLVSLFAARPESLLLPSQPIRSIGLGLAFVGVAVFVTAMATMKTSWRAGIDASQQTRLIRRGIYRFTRNPAFVGFDLFYLGFALAFCNSFTLIFLALCITMLHLQILEEEKFLPTVFGQEYTDYRQSTARYFWFL